MKLRTVIKKLTMEHSKIGKYSLNKIKPCKRIWEDIEGKKGENKKTFLRNLKNVKKKKNSERNGNCFISEN